MPMLTWTVKLSVDSSWVADGFDLTDERAKSMLARDLGYAYGHELKAKVTAYPPAERVARLQGYRSRDLRRGIAEVNRIRREGKL